MDKIIFKSLQQESLKKPSKVKWNDPQDEQIRNCLEKLEGLRTELELIIQDGGSCWRMEEEEYRKFIKNNANGVILEISSEFYRLACIGDENHSEWIIWIQET